MHLIVSTVSKKATAGTEDLRRVIEDGLFNTQSLKTCGSCLSPCSLGSLPTVYNRATTWNMLYDT